MRFYLVFQAALLAGVRGSATLEDLKMRVMQEGLTDELMEKIKLEAGPVKASRDIFPKLRAALADASGSPSQSTKNAVKGDMFRKLGQVKETKVERRANEGLAPLVPALVENERKGEMSLSFKDRVAALGAKLQPPTSKQMDVVAPKAVLPAPPAAAERKKLEVSKVSDFAEKFGRLQKHPVDEAGAVPPSVAVVEDSGARKNVLTEMLLKRQTAMVSPSVVPSQDVSSAGLGRSKLFEELRNFKKADSPPPAPVDANTEAKLAIVGEVERILKADGGAICTLPGQDGAKPFCVEVSAGSPGTAEGKAASFALLFNLINPGDIGVDKIKAFIFAVLSPA